MQCASESSLLQAASFGAHFPDCPKKIHQKQESPGNSFGVGDHHIPQKGIQGIRKNDSAKQSQNSGGAGKDDISFSLQISAEGGGKAVEQIKSCQAPEKVAANLGGLWADAAQGDQMSSGGDDQKSQDNGYDHH